MFLFIYYYIQPPIFRIASDCEPNRILIEKNEREMGKKNFKVFQLINSVVYVTKKHNYTRLFMRVTVITCLETNSPQRISRRQSHTKQKCTIAIKMEKAMQWKE